jgi:hypothetical protein
MLNSSMADPVNLDSKTFVRTSALTLPEPKLTVFPGRDLYVGAPLQSDTATLAGPLSTPKQRVPGDGMPGEPWRSVDPASIKRGAFRR